MFKYASLIGVGLLACGLSQQAQATVVYQLDFENSTDTQSLGTGYLYLNFASSMAAQNVGYTTNSSYFTELMTSQISTYGPFTVTGANLGSFSIQTGSTGGFNELTVAENVQSGLQFSIDLYTGQWQIHNGAGAQQPNYEIAHGDLIVTSGPTAVTPLPAGLPLIAGGLGLVGWFSRGRKQKAALAA